VNQQKRKKAEKPRPERSGNFLVLEKKKKEKNSGEQARLAARKEKEPLVKGRDEGDTRDRKRTGPNRAESRSSVFQNGKNSKHHFRTVKQKAAGRPGSFKRSGDRKVEKNFNGDK